MKTLRLIIHNPFSGTEKIFLFIIIFLSTLPRELIAQKTTQRFATIADVTIDSSKRRIISRSCSEGSSYLPDSLHPEYTPMFYVRINVHVMQDAIGQNNFSEGEGRKWVRQMVQDANQRLGNNTRMMLPHGHDNPALPVPFRFVLTGVPNNSNDDGIYFHADDSLFCMNKKARGKQLNSVFDQRQYKKYGLQKDSVINIFLIEHCPDSLISPTYKASNDGVGLGNWAKLAGSYYIWKHPNITQRGDTFRFTTWDAAGLLNHELGHCLGLQHTWNMDDGCDDTPKNPGCWNFNEPQGCQEVSNNVMDYNAYKNALSPCQISKVIQNFYNNRSVGKYAEPRWCEYDSSKTTIIHSGENVEWNGSRDQYGDLIVENNATLTVRCTLSLPPRGEIILYPRATLILEGCVVTSRCSDSFEGIKISTRKKHKPIIKMINGAVVQNVKHTIGS
ncbi:MAG: M43 family zinc metalloprotease [Chitinophagales bacterium]